MLNFDFDFDFFLFDPYLAKPNGKFNDILHFGTIPLTQSVVNPRPPSVAHSWNICIGEREGRQEARILSGPKHVAFIFVRMAHLVIPAPSLSDFSSLWGSQA